MEIGLLHAFSDYTANPAAFAKVADADAQRFVIGAGIASADKFEREQERLASLLLQSAPARAARSSPAKLAPVRPPGLRDSSLRSE
jgi:hypothetical protein